MVPREAQIVAALEAFAAGVAPPAVDVSSPSPLEQLRAAADILATAHRSARFARPFLVELFRAQHEFNHRVVDLVEDLPWFGGRPERSRFVAQRLVDAAAWRFEPPRRPGVRGALTAGAKAAFGLGASTLLWVWLQQLERSNQAVIDALSLPSHLAPPSLERALSLLPRQPLAPLRAQRAFLSALRDLVREYGPSLDGGTPAIEKAEAVRCPGVSVVLVGTPSRPVSMPFVDEVLCEVLPPGAAGNARVGDVEDATGEWIVRLPADEVFHPGARFAAALQGPANLVYGDAVIEGRPALRPGWSPEALWSTNWVGECFAVRSSIARAAQLSRGGRGALEWLLKPRFAAKDVARVVEFVSTRAVPHPADHAAELGAVREDLARRGLEGTVEAGPHGRVARLKPRNERVSIIVPFRDKANLLRGLWSSLQAFEPGVEWELLLVSNQSQEPETFELLAQLKDPRVRQLEWNEPFNFSTINNVAARQATGRWLLFLNNDVEAAHDGWLADLLGYAQVPGVGVVGARLNYADGSLQHAGVVIGLKGLAGHVFARWRPEYGLPFFGSPLATRNWSAVTGACLLIERARFEAIGGFDEALRISGGDIELCLRACADGSRVVVPGHVSLFHFESVSRGREPVPQGDVRGEVRAYLPLLRAGDPAFHPLLSLDATGGVLALRNDTPLERALRAIGSRLSA